MAKIIIDIDDDKYENIKNHYYFMYETGVMFAIKNGVLLPTNPTNGDMVKALFPKKKFDSCDIDWFGEDWWNAPYEVKQ